MVKGQGLNWTKIKQKVYRKDNYDFGIDFVECIKIVGFKIGNNVTLDDIWHPIYVKFEKVLNLWKSRHLSLLEKSIVVNVLASSKIWYIGSVLNMSKYYICKFQRLISNLVWNSKLEPFALKTMYLWKHSGGLNIVNIEYKLYALGLKHIQEIILNRNTKFVNFSIYWIGYKLRDLNFSLASLSVPHSDLVSPFYNKCLKVLNISKDKCNDMVLGQYNTKTLYNLLLDSDEHVIKIVERNVDIDYSFVFKNVFDKFIDTFSGDVLYRIIHDILPVNILMFKYNISKTYKCVYCNEVETLRHLFF